MAKKKTSAPAEEQVRKVEETEGTAREGVQVEDIFPEGVDTSVLTAVDSANGLNLRTGPSVGYSVAEVLPDGTILAVQQLPCGAEVLGWVLVHDGQRTGWVDARFIRALELATAED